MAKYNSVVIGAGPGGLACAKKLAEDGKSVVVIEKNEIIGDKVCAGGITGKEIGKIVPRELLGKTFESGYISIGPKEKRIKINVPKNSIGTIPRERLGQYMAEEVDRLGVEIITKTTIVEIKEDHVLDERGNRFYFDNLVGADGSSSIVRKYLGIPTEKIGPTIQYKVPRLFDNIEIFVDIQNFGPFYIWIFPHDTYTEVGTGAFTKLIPFSDVKQYFDKWLERHAIDVSSAELRSAPINCDYRGFQFKNIYLVGDAAGFADGFTGEGIYTAVVSGQEAARKIIDPHYSLEKIQHLVSHKHQTEQLLRMYVKHEKIAQRFGNQLSVFMLRQKWFQRRLINTFLY